MTKESFSHSKMDNDRLGLMNRSIMTKSPSAVILYINTHGMPLIKSNYLVGTNYITHINELKTKRQRARVRVVVL